MTTKTKYNLEEMERELGYLKATTDGWEPKRYNIFTEKIEHRIDKLVEVKGKIHKGKISLNQISQVDWLLKQYSELRDNNS